MAWSTIRKATPHDIALLEERAVSFTKRHQLQRQANDTAVTTVENTISPRYGESDADRYDRTYLRKLWLAIAHRALNHPWATGIAHGYVGYWVK